MNTNACITKAFLFLQIPLGRLTKNWLFTAKAPRGDPPLCDMVVTLLTQQLLLPHMARPNLTGAVIPGMLQDHTRFLSKVLILCAKLLGLLYNSTSAFPPKPPQS